MKMPVPLARTLARFDALSTRERALVAGAAFIGIVLLWVAMVFDPLSVKQRTLNAELATLQQSIQLTSQSIQETTAADPTLVAQREEKNLKTQLALVNAQLAAKSAGLIPPERMVQVIHDVLSRQHGVKLVSLHNSPVTTLVTSSAQGAQSGGPYVHPVEIVVEGTYLDVLAYLHALESLEWRFYWRLLQLESTAYPRNRVRIELSTLSLDKDWIGV
ncbi:MAG TPA: type II secretion system protein GspM [Steroidobacteraceae bacterium]|nr:type II secretion system protein GspM [Steroidobacteraceae bacterium]